MLPPLITRPGKAKPHQQKERGATMAIVALAIVSIIAMAALSIDVGTLYEANTEAQRSADAAALAAARVLSLSGLTGDPQNSSGLWSSACTLATQTAQSVANLNTVAGQAPSSVTTTFLSSDAGSSTPSGCGSTGAVAFGVNPMVTVKVTQKNLPAFFAPIFGLLKGYSPTTVSASATAEAFNSSASENFNGGTLVPVQPRCVKPWIVPDADPGNPGKQFVAITDGTIQTPGILVSGAGTGVIGETFNLKADCGSTAGNCATGAPDGLSPGASPGLLYYVPGLVPGAPSEPAGAPPVAIPSCANADPYQQAIAGCDQTTQYQCGVSSATATNPNYVDLTENPIAPSVIAGDTYVAAQCLTNQLSGTADQISTAVYPYQITAGSGNPLNANGTIITSSNSIVSLPIYTTGATNKSQLFPNGSGLAPVNIVGFLQVFIQSVNSDGSLTVYVLNVSGCGNGSTGLPLASPPLDGTSPVPIRLVTPPAS
jgi:Flp pilus assembly protein TadG